MVNPRLAKAGRARILMLAYLSFPRPVARQNGEVGLLDLTDKLNFRGKFG